MTKGDQKQQAEYHRVQQERFATKAADEAAAPVKNEDTGCLPTLIVIVAFMMIGLLSPVFFGGGFILFLIALLILLIAVPIFMLGKK